MKVNGMGGNAHPGKGVKIMDVKCAKKHMADIKEICGAALAFCEKHEELSEETGFLCDAVAYLGDYRKVLEKAIDRAELDI